jgi:hypothetical protein
MAWDWVAVGLPGLGGLAFFDEPGEPRRRARPIEVGGGVAPMAGRPPACRPEHQQTAASANPSASATNACPRHLGDGLANEPVWSAGMIPRTPERLMLDPSFVLSADGVAWLEEDISVRREDLVLPATFMYWLTAGRPDGDELLRHFVARDDLEAYEDRSKRLIGLLEGVSAFRSDSVMLDGSPANVLSSLVRSTSLPEAVVQVRCEEWVYLWSHSWLLSKLHTPLDAFRDAGAAVVEYGRAVRDRMIGVVMPNEPLPTAVTVELLGKAAAKWLVVGGTGAAGTLLGPLGGALAPMAIPLVQAFDP